MQSEIQENYKVFDFCLESVRACMCVSLQTCQAVDHSFPPLALSPSSHTIFFFSPLHKHRVFLGRPESGLDLLYSGIMGREGFPTQGG